MRRQGKGWWFKVYGLFNQTPNMTRDTNHKIEEFLTRTSEFHKVFESHALSDATNFAALQASMASLKASFDAHTTKMDAYMDKTEPRLRSLEDFRLKFVVRFSLLSACAIFIGTLMAQIGITFVTQHWLK